MFRDIPIQPSFDIDSVFSRFDDQTKPPNVTVWESASVDVVFNAATQPKEILTSNTRVAGGNLMPKALLTGMGTDDWPVQLNGFNPGSVVLTAVNDKGVALSGTQQLEVLVLRQQELFLDFFFVTDWLGTTKRNASWANRIALDSLNSIFAPAAIRFRIHSAQSVRIDVRLDDTLTKVQEFNRRREAIVKLGRKLVNESRHIQVFCVPLFRLLDGVKKDFDAQGHTEGRNIIVEDTASEVSLAHEVGHALGLRHELKRSDALMAERPNSIFLTRSDILKIGMMR